VSGRSTQSNDLALVRDLLEPTPARYWLDFGATALVAWGAFLAALLAPVHPAWVAALAATAVFASYRALCYIHEIVHIRPGRLRGFARSWNAVIGIPFLFPLFLYDGVHRDHHSAATYGSARDPEYLPLAGRRLRIALLVLLSAAVPAVLALRFLVLSVVGLAIPPLHRWLERNASSLVMNVRYVREVDASTRARIVRTELSILALWYGWIGLAVAGVLPWRAFALWYAIAAGIVLLNSLRSLGAHAYRSHGQALTREEQVADSIDIRGGWWSELWAPLGLRFHALHHLYPTIPYHNLAQAHRRLTAGKTASPVPVSPGLRQALGALWSSAPTQDPADTLGGAGRINAPRLRFPLPRSARPAAR
jgi:fatty acid desaturase